MLIYCFFIYFASSFACIFYYTGHRVVLEGLLWIHFSGRKLLNEKARHTGQHLELKKELDTPHRAAIGEQNIQRKLKEKKEEKKKSLRTN